MSPVKDQIPPPPRLTPVSLTFLAQEEGVEAEMIDAEVQPALAGYPALPAAAGVIGDQLLCLREVEPGLKLDQGLPELLRVFLLLSKPAARLLCNQSLTHRQTMAPHSGRRTWGGRKRQHRKASALLNNGRTGWMGQLTMSFVHAQRHTTWERNKLGQRPKDRSPTWPLSSLEARGQSLTNKL